MSTIFTLFFQRASRSLGGMQWVCIKDGKMTKLICPCSNEVTIDDGHDRHFPGECSTCVGNGGVFTLSLHWKEPELAQMSMEERYSNVIELYGKPKPSKLKPSKPKRPADDELKDPQLDRKAARRASAAQAGQSSPEFRGRRS